MEQLISMVGKTFEGPPGVLIMFCFVLISVLGRIIIKGLEDYRDKLTACYDQLERAYRRRDG